MASRSYVAGRRRKRVARARRAAEARYLARDREPLSVVGAVQFEGMAFSGSHRIEVAFSRDHQEMGMVVIDGTRYFPRTPAGLRRLLNRLIWRGVVRAGAVSHSMPRNHTI